MLWLVAFALADSGEKSCAVRGLPVQVKWTEEGRVRVYDGPDLLVSTEVGPLKGTTTVKCSGDKLQFLTDTHAIPGKITLEKVSIGLGEVLDTLDPDRFVAKPPPVVPRKKKAPVPAPRARPIGVAAAEACVNTKAWSDYGAGWRVRTVTADTLLRGGSRNYAVTLLEGNSYRFFGCAQSSVSDLRLVIYADEGKVVAVAPGHSRQPQVDFTPGTTGTYHVILSEPEASGDVGVALGVVYR